MQNEDSQSSSLSNVDDAEEDEFAGLSAAQKRQAEATKALNLKQAVFGQSSMMARSGPGGGTLMCSRPGKQTIAQYLCFSNGVKQKAHVPTDPMDFHNRPIEEIKE